MDENATHEDDRLALVEESWNANYGRVVAYAVRRGFGQHDAEEIAAEAFAIAYRKPEQGSLDLPWLLATARRVASNRRRSEGRRANLLVRLRRERPAPGPALEDPDGPVAAAFASLSDADREVLALVAWDGLEPREAAVVLGVSPGAVSVRLHRAKQRLKKRLAAGTGERDGRERPGHDLSEVTE